MTGTNTPDVAALVERLDPYNYTYVNNDMKREIVAALTAAQERVKALEADLETLGNMHDNSDALMAQMEAVEKRARELEGERDGFKAMADRVIAERDKYREALEPFARYPDEPDRDESSMTGMRVTFQELRQAKRALSDTQPEGHNND